MNSILNDEKLGASLLRAGLIKRTECTDQENAQFRYLLAQGQPLPNGVYYYESYETNEEGIEQSVPVFFRITPSDLTEADESAMLERLKACEIITIRKWVQFFGILTVISLVGGLISLIISLVH